MAPASLVRSLGVASLAATLLSALWGSAAVADEVVEEDTGDTITWMVRPSDAVAEDGRSWIERELDPGESVREHLLVRNLGTETVTFQLSAADGYFTDTGRFNMLTSDRPSTGAGTWIGIQSTVDVPPDADVAVPFTISVPLDAAPGDHPAGVAAAVRSAQGGQLGVESRVGFRVMTRVSGELVLGAEAHVEAEYAGSWNPFEAGDVTIEYTIANTGNARVSINPRLALTGPFGLMAREATAEPIAEIPPGETRTATVLVPGVWPLVHYSATISGDAVAIRTGEGAEPTPTAFADSRGVDAIPWSQLMALLIAAVLVWAWRRDRRRRRRVLEVMLEDARREGAARSTAAQAEDGVDVHARLMSLTPERSAESGYFAISQKHSRSTSGPALRRG